MSSILFNKQNNNSVIQLLFYCTWQHDRGVSVILFWRSHLHQLTHTECKRDIAKTFHNLTNLQTSVACGILLLRIFSSFFPKLLYFILSSMYFLCTKTYVSNFSAYKSECCLGEWACYHLLSRVYRSVQRRVRGSWEGGKGRVWGTAVGRPAHKGWHKEENPVTMSKRFTYRRPLLKHNKRNLSSLWGTTPSPPPNSLQPLSVQHVWPQRT